AVGAVLAGDRTDVHAALDRIVDRLLPVATLLTRTPAYHEERRTRSCSPYKRYLRALRVFVMYRRGSSATSPLKADYTAGAAARRPSIQASNSLNERPRLTGFNSCSCTTSAVL